jgi:hypothetical protein
VVTFLTSSLAARGAGLPFVIQSINPWRRVLDEAEREWVEVQPITLDLRRIEVSSEAAVSPDHAGGDVEDVLPPYAEHRRRTEHLGVGRVAGHVGDAVVRGASHLPCPVAITGGVAVSSAPPHSGGAEDSRGQLGLRVHLDHRAVVRSHLLPRI